MAGLFDDLPDAKSGADAGLFDDIPDAQPVKPEPVQSGFFSQLLADIKGLFSKPPSVLESAPADPQAFDFKGASALARRQDDAAARVAQHGSMGPITGPQASASSVASGLAGSVRAGALRARAGINQAAADAVGVPVPVHHDHVRARAGQLEARGYRQGAAMDGVKAVGADVVGELGAAADARDDHHLVRRDLQVHQRLL